MANWYRKKEHPDISAIEWFKKGDHPDINMFAATEERGSSICEKCNRSMFDHGWATGWLEGSPIVCPGDWVVNLDNQGQSVAILPPEVFRATYEGAEDDQNN